MMIAKRLHRDFARRPRGSSCGSGRATCTETSEAAMGGPLRTYIHNSY